MMEQPAEETRKVARVPRTKSAKATRIGLIVLAALLMLTWLEYVVFLVVPSNLPLMLVMNVADAALIIYFFMHVTRVWRSENEEGS